MQWTEVGPRGKYTAIPGMDSRADWLFGPGIQDYLPFGEDVLIPFIMNLHDDAGIAIIQALIKADSPIFIPSVYTRRMKAGEYFTAISNKAFFDELAKEDGAYNDLRNAAKEMRLGAPLQGSALSIWKPGERVRELTDPPIGPPVGGWPPGTVVVGVIDDGIAFANAQFRTDNHGTRVQCFWRMDPPDESTSVERGREICKHDDAAGNPGIDSLLASSTIAGSVDEDLFYRAAGLIDFTQPYHKAAAWRFAHGTHVLDLAAGADPADDLLDRPIVAVQLPTATTANTSGADLAEQVLRAVDYILERADALAGGTAQLPVVINFSYGLIAGPHDGTSELERGLDARIQARLGSLQIVLPAGNSHLSRCHARVHFTPKEQDVELEWRVPPDDKTPSFVEIWLPHAGATAPAASRLTLSVVAPGGPASPQLGEIHNTGVHLLDDSGQIICAASYVFEPWPTERGRFLIELEPTARLRPTVAPVAPAGIWRIRLQNVLLAADEPVHAWIQRDDTPYGYPRFGRQSYFDEACYVRFDPQGREIEDDTHPEQAGAPCHVRRASLVNALATGTDTIVAGGYRRRELPVARYSAGEPITPARGGAADPAFRKPDATLVSEDSKVHAGVLAAGSRSGSRVAGRGTSVAAPQLARWVAGQLAAGNPGDRNAVKAQAIADEGGLPAWKPPLPPERGGWGRMRRNLAFPRPRYWD